MSKCRKCGGIAATGMSVCHTCIDKRNKMREEIFEFLKTKYGEVNYANHSVYVKETKRLSNLWKRDKELFRKELGR